MSSGNYPTFIHVANLKNIFWNNNSDLYPTTTPSIDLYKKIDDIRPTFPSPYSGLIILEGEFNHAIYNDKYYRLLKIRTIDFARKIYEYQMEEDVMMNFMFSGGEVKGVLNRTNVPEILEDNLNYTQPILETPAKVAVNLFQDVKATWKETAQFIPYVLTKGELSEKILETYISARDWYNFHKRLEGNIFIEALKDPKKWNTKKESGSQRHSYNPLFLVDLLAPTIGLSWKMLVLGKIVEFVKDWSDKKVSVVPSGDGALLQGKTCITYENQSFAIGTTQEEQLQLREVDLSGLTDIVLVDDNGTPIDHKNPVSPTYYRFPDVSKDLLPDGMGEGGTPDIPIGWYLKLCRHPYLPIRPKNKALGIKERFIPIESNQYPALRNFEDTNYTGEAPQEILFKHDRGISSSLKGWLWYINKLDFAMIEGFGWDYKDDDLLKTFRYLSFFDENKTKWGDYYFFRNLNRKDIPPVGFLMYQLRYDRSVWDEYEYIGDNNPKQFQYRSGLTTNLIETAKDENKWWSNPPTNLELINGNRELSLLTLELENFIWMCFTPVPKGFLYPWVPNSYYNHFKYFEYSNSNPPYYPYDFFSWDIKGNGQVVKPLLTTDKVKVHLDRRANIIDGVSIYDAIDFSNPIAKDDVFVSDLEWRWKTTSYHIKELPFEIPEGVFDKIAAWSSTVQGVTGAAAGTGAALVIAKGLAGAADLVKMIGGIKPALQAIKTTNLFLVGTVLKPTFRTVRLTKLKDIFTIGKTIKNVSFFAGGLSKGAKVLMALTTIGSNLLKIGVKGLIAEAVIRGIIYAIEKNTPDIEKRLMNSIWTMGDFFDGEEIDISSFDSCFVLYLNKGTFKFGTFNVYEKILKLDESEQQIIENVEGTKSRKTKFTHIQKLGDLSIEGEQFLTEQKKNELFRAIYKSFRKTPDGRIINISLEDLEDFNNKITFDLVGTKWYAQFRKGRVHLIAKDKSPFDPKEGVNVKEINFDESIKPSVYAKINQKSDLVIYSTVLPLNTKFTFSPEKERDAKHFLRVRSMVKDLEAILGTEDNSPKQYWHVEYRTPYDYINTWVSVFKTKGMEIKPLSLADYEKLKLSKERTDWDYWIGTEQNKNIVSDRKLKTARQIEDLDHEFTRRLAGAGASSIMAGAKAAAFRGGLPAGVAAAGLGAASGLISAFMFKWMEQEGLAERYTQDELNFMRDNTLSQYNRMQNYEFKKSEHIINLNALTNTYIKPTSSDDDVQRAMNKSNAWDDIHIKCYLPTIEQEKMIKEIYDEHGCHCRSEWFLDNPLIIQNNMNEGLYQFSNLENTSILSTYTTDLTVYDVVKNIFLNGTKFINFKHEALQEETHTFVVPKDTEIDFDTSKMDEWDDRLWDVYTVTKPKSEILKIIKNISKHGLTDEEYEANKSQLEGVDDDTLFKNVSRIITNRRRDSHYVLPAPTQTKEDIHNAEIHLLKVKIGELEQKLAEAQQQTGHKEFSRDILQEKINELRKELQKTNKDCEADKGALREQITNLESQKSELDRKIKELEGQITGLNTQITTLQNQMKALEDQKNAEIRQHKIDKEVAEQKWDDKQREYLNEKAARERLAKEKEQLEASIVAKDTSTKKEREDLAKKIVEETRDLFDAAGKIPTDPPKVVIIDKSTPPDIAAMQNVINRLHEGAKKLKEDQRRQRNRFDREKKQILKDKEDAITARDAAIAEQLRLAQELETCRKVGGPIDEVTDEQSCKMLHNIIDPLVNIEVKPARGGNQGWDSYLELSMAFAERMKRMRVSDLEQYLNKYQVIRPLFLKLYDMEKTPLVNEFLDVLTNNYWYGVISRITRGDKYSDYYSDEKTLLARVLKLKENFETQGHMLHFKTLFDDAILLATTARSQLKVELEGDRDLQFMFKHIFPGELIPLYEEVFGDIRLGPAIRQFKSLPCTSTTHAFKQLAEIVQKASHTPSDIDHIGTMFSPSSVVYNWERLPDLPIEEQQITSLKFVCSEKLGETCNYPSNVDGSGLIFYRSNYYKKGDGGAYKVAWTKVFEGNHSSDEVYFRVDDRQKALPSYDDLQLIRQTAWDNRHKVDNQFPQVIKDALSNGTLTLDLNVASLYDKIHDLDEFFKQERAYINIKQIFGEQAEDALRMILIFTQIKFSWGMGRPSSGYDGYTVVGIYFKNTLSPESIKTADVEQYWVGLQQFRIKANPISYPYNWDQRLYVSVDFTTIKGFLTFIAKCVRDKKVYDPRNTKGGSILDKLYRTIRNMANDPN